MCIQDQPTWSSWSNVEGCMYALTTMLSTRFFYDIFWGVPPFLEGKVMILWRSPLFEVIEGRDMWVQIFADLIFTCWPSLPFGNVSKYLMNMLMFLVSMWCLFHRWRIEFSPRRWIDSWQTLWQTVVRIGVKFTEEKEVPPRSCWAHGGLLLLLLWLWLGGTSVLLNPTRSMWGSLIPSCTVSVAVHPSRGKMFNSLGAPKPVFWGCQGWLVKTIRDLIILGQALSVKVHTLM